MIARQLGSFAVRTSAASAAASVARSSAATASRTATRALSISAIARAAGPPVLLGDGAKDGEVPTDEAQATGLERYELLGRLEGVDVFDLKPLDASRTGTLKDPIVIQSLWHERVIGCTGSPAGSHDTVYLHLNTELKHHRCPECGSVYKLDFIGDADAGHH
ncbi:Cytochrome c oxidase subunit 4 [Tilletia horrida]|uniref:Cytochrome c oxidase subunit 4, mitochondrial n=1 Tax=Tilletia horrida TaxID=155126 RepID=A0AAN6JQR0_9BASI|nr:Cytochrome c oxidase subunit 4 [Tilletia horrida]KAK0547360.1 Cytochrome c oxidase subunit 4 [Tilletia horrida]KAK0562789.1 Cytochrome c oxidase subunit 4 [Tilletia horrida]